MDTGRLITAMVTPMTEDLEVDYERAKELAKRLVDQRSDGLLIAGTTGESPTLTHDEKLRLFDAVLDAVGDQVMVWAGTGGNNTASSKAFTHEAEAAGVHGIMLVTPYYNKPSQEGIVQHFAEVASVTTLPIMAYNIPGRTGTNIKADTMIRMAEEIPNLAVVKEASGDVEQVADIVRGAPKGLTVLSGDDKMTLPFMAVGAKGVVSVAAHICGPDMADMIQAFDCGQSRAAMNLHFRLLPLFRGLFLTTNPVPVKTALRLAGFSCGNVRLPLVPMTDAEERTLEDILRHASVV